jgi:hypothetical protein
VWSARVVLIIGSIAVSLLLALAAPRAWEIDPAHGVLLGFALYAGALRRYARRRELEAVRDRALGRSPGWSRRVPGLLVRTAAFFAVAGALAYVLFEAAPGADLRAAFIILSSWIVLESVVDPAAPERGGGSTERARPSEGSEGTAAERC